MSDRSIENAKNACVLNKATAHTQNIHIDISDQRCVFCICFIGTPINGNLDGMKYDKKMNESGFQVIGYSKTTFPKKGFFGHKLN